MELITHEPVILVEHCDDGNFKAHPDGLKALRLIKASGIKVICIAGQYRQGKSYLANKLMGQQSGFGVGHTVVGKTRGVWMWATDGGEGGEADGAPAADGPARAAPAAARLARVTGGDCPTAESASLTNSSSASTACANHNPRTAVTQKNWQIDE
mgnify:CR=1 FL=1